MSNEEGNSPLKKEECQKRILGLEEILVNGEEKIQARFQASIITLSLIHI